MVTDLQISPLEKKKKKSGIQFNHIAFCSIYQRELQLNTLNTGKNVVNHPRGALRFVDGGFCLFYRMED